MANMDLVTSHRGVAHITTQNVIDLIAGLSGDISGVKIFPQLYDGLAHVIESTTRVKVKKGAALAGGYFFILNEAFNWNLDPGATGYSRIDVLYLVIYEDFGTTVQSCDFVYRVGTAYPNGQSGQVPSAPSGTNIIATFPFLRANMTDGAVVSVTSYAQDYLSNDALDSKIATPFAAFENLGIFNILTLHNINGNVSDTNISKDTWFTYCPNNDGEVYLALALQNIQPEETIQNGTNANIYKLSYILQFWSFKRPFGSHIITQEDIEAKGGSVALHDYMSFLPLYKDTITIASKIVHRRPSGTFPFSYVYSMTGVVDDKYYFFRAYDYLSGSGTGHYGEIIYEIELEDQTPFHDLKGDSSKKISQSFTSGSAPVIVVSTPTIEEGDILEYYYAGI